MPLSQMHLPTNIVPPYFMPLYENGTALDKILEDFFRSSNSFPSPQVKRSVANMS